MFSPSFGDNLSEDPHSVVIAHVLKVYVIHLVGWTTKYAINSYLMTKHLLLIFLSQKYYFEGLHF